jgi:hypothetical protein
LLVVVAVVEWQPLLLVLMVVAVVEVQVELLDKQFQLHLAHHIQLLLVAVVQVVVLEQVALMALIQLLVHC